MVEFKNVHLSYEGKTLFEDFNLKIDRGETLLLNGPSGRGKSTLLRMVPGFVRPDKGEILIDGIALNRHTVKELRTRVSYVSQDVDLRDEPVDQLLSEIFSYKINKHITTPMKRVEEFLDEFALNRDILTKQVRELSGGERQRLGIIICLLLDRDIWLLDEITSALDGDLKEQVVQRICGSNKTLIIVSHDPQWAEAPHSRVVNL